MDSTGFQKFISVVFVLLFVITISINAQPPAKAVDLRCEFMMNPEGIDRPAPRLGWRMQQIAGTQGQHETAYRILVASSQSVLDTDTGDLWDSGKVTGERPVLVSYAGKTLKSFQNYYWKVKIWDENGEEQSWSDTAHWAMGILDASQWQAKWLGYVAESEKNIFAPDWYENAKWIWHPEDKDIDLKNYSRFFKTRLSVSNLAELQQAEILLCANDAFQLFVNGKEVSGIIAYRPEVPAPQYNIKPYLKNGDNEIFIQTWKYDNPDPAGLIGVVKIVKKDGDVETIETTEQWLVAVERNGKYEQADEVAPASYKWRRTPGWRQTEPSPVFRKAFSLNKEIVSAKIAISGLGYYELYCNGKKVGDHRLDPAFTNYNKRVLYTCYELKDYLEPGKNALGVMLGSGWFDIHTRATWDFDGATWRDKPKMMAQMQITFADGTQETIVSDLSWKASTGPVIRDGIRNGEMYDARQEQPGWDQPGFDDSAWHSPKVVLAPKGILDSQTMPPVRVVETLVPVSVTEPEAGVFVVDMGTNMAGWARLLVDAAQGDTIQVRYSERLDEKGMINQRRNARYVCQGPFQTDTYIAKDGFTQVWEPRFTYHGFRYVEVTGLDKLTTDMIQGRVANTDFETIGHFKCSNDLLNTIYKITARSYQSNYMGYPTDCPQREKNGWTGDAQLASELGMLNYNNIPAYNKWAYDLLDARTPKGDLPGIAPTPGWGYRDSNGPGWGSAAVMVPWNMYLYSGDTGILEDHYDLASEYVNFLNQRFPDHIVEMGRGDWCYFKTKTPGRVTSTALYYNNIKVLEEMASVLGKNKDAERYDKLAEKVKKAYNNEFYKGDGIYDLCSQTSQAISVFNGLVPEAEMDAAIAQLVNAVHAGNDHVDCGILGAKALFRALTLNGQHELAYKVATQPDFPGYGDWISKGATALWEDWTDTEGSLNHVMFGDIVTWFYRELAGINPVVENPGFKHILIQPKPVGDLTHVNASTRSLYGEIKSEWKIVDGKFILNVSIPPNSTADILMPDGSEHQVGSGQYEFVCK